MAQLIETEGVAASDSKVHLTIQWVGTKPDALGGGTQTQCQTRTYLHSLYMYVAINSLYAVLTSCS